MLNFRTPDQAQQLLTCVADRQHFTDAERFSTHQWLQSDHATRAACTKAIHKAKQRIDPAWRPIAQPNSAPMPSALKGGRGPRDAGVDRLSPERAAQTFGPKVEALMAAYLGE